MICLRKKYGPRDSSAKIQLEPYNRNTNFNSIKTIEKKHLPCLD
ncbi:hypothetical protein EV13_0006 [Prochlorococcus sp. MIT 0702]|nr:hypothetical protein EV13_0006 [Prochlorococcus sp. MIT 0702]